MGVSTDAELSFGILFDEGFEFPWDTEEYEEDPEAWWRDHKGYKPPHDPWTESGEYAEGWTKDDPRLEEYFDSQREWDKKNPLPFRIVNYCSGEYPAYILAVPAPYMVAKRGYPERIRLPELEVNLNQDAIDMLVAFCKEQLGCEGTPYWYLSSYLG